MIAEQQAVILDVLVVRAAAGDIGSCLTMATLPPHETICYFRRSGCQICHCDGVIILEILMIIMVIM